MNDDSILYHKHHPPPLSLDEDLDDDELFRQAMAQVKPLSNRTKERKNGKGHDDHGEEEKILSPRDVLQEFLQEQTGESFEQTTCIEGGPQDWNRLLVRKLRQGEFSVQAELDLHGFSRREAKRSLRQFIEECSRRSLTCVRIVHGKGKNSRNRVPVLKKQIPVWLSHRTVSRYLIAYTSARRVDGGGGAIYVLLRKT